MKILVHHYTLRPSRDPWRALAGPRDGALLRVEFDDRTVGHADLHPWPEFGNEPLGAQLASLAAGEPVPQAALALRHARADAAARRGGSSLFAGLPAVASHALFTDWTRAPRAAFEACAGAGFHAVKLKVGRNPAGEARALGRLAGLPLRWRLDANALFTTDSFRAWTGLLDAAVRRMIEFVEDPCAYDPGTWPALARDTGLRLALDWQLPSRPPPWPGAAVVVLKPSVQDVVPLADQAASAGLQLVVTHSLDHPLGRATALWTAMVLRQRHGDAVAAGGLGGDDLAPPDGWPAPGPGPVPRPPAGTGFGFDSLLAATPWRTIR